MASRKPQHEADDWNSRVAPGDQVYYRSHPGAPPERLFTDGAAYVLSGHTAVLFLKHKAGCVAVSACEPVGAARTA